MVSGAADGVWGSKMEYHYEEGTAGGIQGRQRAQLLSFLESPRNRLKLSIKGPDHHHTVPVM